MHAAIYSWWMLYIDMTSRPLIIITLNASIQLSACVSYNDAVTTNIKFCIAPPTARDGSALQAEQAKPKIEQDIVKPQQRSW